MCGGMGTFHGGPCQCGAGKALGLLVQQPQAVKLPYLAVPRPVKTEVELLRDLVAQCEGGVWYWFMPEGEVKVFRAAQDNGRIIATQGRVLDQPGMFWLYAKLPKSARPKPVHDYPAHATAIVRSIA
jgi:hypothetical protein